MASKPRVLLVDDDFGVLSCLEMILAENYEVKKCTTGKEALVTIGGFKPDLVFLDLYLPDYNGLEILNSVREKSKNILVIILTAHDSARMALRALENGAYTYITKPFDVEDVLKSAKNALNHLAVEAMSFSQSNIASEYIPNFIGKSKNIVSLYETALKLSRTDVTVMITGESGSGKELIARTMHYSGARAKEPFVAINCAAIPEKLMESEFFGYEKGAFTDATESKIGLIENAHKGTLFLDEVAELSWDMQAKLLRVLEDGYVRKVGGTKSVQIDVRIISATNADLAERVAAKVFRKDLFYRLNVVPLRIPPLRERKEDVPELLRFYLKKSAEKFSLKSAEFSPEAMETLSQYAWPGNVRELKNIVERLLALSGNGLIAESDIPYEIKNTGAMERLFESNASLAQATDNFEKKYIQKVLKEFDHNQTRAAEFLGVHRNALFNKMKKFGLK